ncbi:MAG: hypothetical protein L3K03_06465 [Thermoplasmata archaeon]|nr:hypothetical protein [Thermoplasmata archaeon]
MVTPRFVGRAFLVGVLGWAFLLILFGITILLFVPEARTGSDAWVGLIPILVGLVYVIILGLRIGQDGNSSPTGGEAIRVKFARIARGRRPQN